jgi:hypothetical protein
LLKKPDSSGSSGVEVVEVEDLISAKLEVNVSVDSGPVYGTEDKLELERPMPASMVFVLGSGRVEARLVL